jgi:hypothetical protein
MDSTGGIFMKLQMNDATQSVFKLCQLRFYRPIVKDTLLGEQSTFQQYLGFRSADFPETTLGALPTNGVILLAIGQ